MQSTAALKEYIDTAIKDALYEEEDQMAYMRERVEATEELLGLAFEGFSRMSTILNYVRNSGGSARTNVLELCEMIESELRHNILGHLGSNVYRGNEVPGQVKAALDRYKQSLRPDAPDPEQEFVDDEFVAVADVLRDE